MSASPDLAVEETASVLIVGGSLVGLCTGLFLGKHGIPSLIVERHPGTSIHPRVASLTARTLEILRWAGAEASIREIEPEFSHNSRVSLAESLTGEEFDNLMEDFSAYFTDASPVEGSLIAQDVLETVLPTLASQAGADLCYRTELVNFAQDEDGVTATLRDLASGTDRRVRTKFLVAADGGRSGIRDQLGIGVHGTGTIGHFVSILFEATGLLDLFRKRDTVLCFLANDVIGVAAGFTAYPGSSVRPHRFRLDVSYDPEKETLADYPDERCISLVRAAIGIDDYPVDTKAKLTWEMVARIADRFEDGRVFLVGDAARAQPPSGALGGNTGIAEAHNLAWKLAAILKGHAGAGLLATYDPERRPVADYTVDQVQALMDQRETEGSAGITVDTLMINMGYRYGEGAAVCAEDGADLLPAAQDPHQWTGEPGTRAPHIVLGQDGQTISSLDLLGSGFVLLTGSAGQDWLAATEHVSQTLSVPLRGYQIGGAAGDVTDSDGRFHDAYGIAANGAVLVRPDGFIGWRSRSGAGDAQEELTGALTTLLFR